MHKVTTKFPKMINNGLDGENFRPVMRNGSLLHVITPVTNTPKLSAKTIEREYIPGQFSPKVGRNRQFTKGDFKGAYFYMLTLVERETCPTTCNAWNFCYGDNSPFIKRYRPDSGAFTRALIKDVETLSKKHANNPAGFAVRLHELGDFASVEYVELWARLLDKYHNLNIVGYTHTQGDISRAIDKMQARHPNRCRIMQSDISSETARPYSITDTPEHRERFPLAFSGDAVRFPEQSGKTASCSTCGLCYNGKTNVIFSVH